MYVVVLGHVLDLRLYVEHLGRVLLVVMPGDERPHLQHVRQHVHARYQHELEQNERLRAVHEQTDGLLHHVQEY